MTAVESLTTKRLCKLQAEESIKKTQKLIYNEVKGTPEGLLPAKENNGDIIKWTSVGKANFKHCDRYAEARRNHPVADLHQRGGIATRERVEPRAGVNRREFVGSGNILTWT